MTHLSQKQRETFWKTETSLLLTYCFVICKSWQGWGQIQKRGAHSGFLMGVTGIQVLDHHLLLPSVHIRKSGIRRGAWLNPGILVTGHMSGKLHLNCRVKHLPWDFKNSLSSIKINLKKEYSLRIMYEYPCGTIRGKTL